MTEHILSPDIIPNDIQWGVVDGTGVGVSPTVLTTRSANSYGNRVLACQMIFREVNDRNRAILMSMIQRGKADRYWLTDITTPLAGSMSAPEVYPNNTFSNSTTGWGGNSISLSDRVLRSALVYDGSSQFELLGPTPDPTVTQYAPYVLRAFTRQGRGSPTYRLALGSSGEYGIGADQADFGMKYLAGVVYGTTLHGWIQQRSTSGLVGDFIDIPYISLSPGGLVDAGNNLVQRSDEFDNAYWTKTKCTVSANSLAAPDGTTTGDILVEDNTSGTHNFSTATGVTVSSAVLDYSLVVAFRPGNRSWCVLRLIENTGVTEAVAYFNVSTGVKGTPVAAGANWASVRSFISPVVGTPWYVCALVARKTNAATSITPVAGAASADGTQSYAGANNNAIGVWRATLAQSSVPSRQVQSTSAAVTGSSQSGSSLYVKGLTASTSSLLKVNDLVEINGELKRSIASLDTDGLGLAVLQFESQIRTPMADNAPVIFQRPHGKFMLVGDRFDWPSRPGANRKSRSDFTLEFIEAPAA